MQCVLQDGKASPGGNSAITVYTCIHTVRSEYYTFQFIKNYTAYSELDPNYVKVIEVKSSSYKYWNIAVHINVATVPSHQEGPAF